MNLREIELDEFIQWVVKFKEDPQGTNDLLMEAANELPMVKRLLMIMQNDMDNGVSEDMIRRNTTLIQFFAALFQIEKEQRTST